MKTALCLHQGLSALDTGGKILPEEPRPAYEQKPIAALGEGTVGFAHLYRYRIGLYRFAWG